MHTVVLFSEPENPVLAQVLGVFGRLGATVVSPSRVRQGDGALTVVYQPHYTALAADAGIALFLNQAPLDRLPRLPEDFFGVCDSSNRWALRALMAGGCRTLTSGMGSRDTLTCSSLSDTAAVLSLRRRAALPGSAAVEPGDFPVRLASPYEPACILAAGAVTLLTGKLPECF